MGGNFRRRGNFRIDGQRQRVVPRGNGPRLLVPALARTSVLTSIRPAAGIPQPGTVTSVITWVVKEPQILQPQIVLPQAGIELT